MRYFIRIDNGVPSGHPIQEDNFKQAFPDIDIDNLPSNFMEFEKDAIPPIFGPYIKYHGPNYEIIGNKVKEGHILSEYSEAEKLERKFEYKKNAEKDKSIPPGWVFNDELCVYTHPNEKHTFPELISSLKEKHNKYLIKIKK